MHIECKIASAISNIYPTSLVLPGRSFSFFEHDMWGPTRRVPYKRVYTQFNASFIIFQNWKEKNEFEAWMDLMIPPSNGGVSSVDVSGFRPPNELETVIDLVSQTANPDSPTLGTSGNSTFSKSYGDTINYDNTGTITIEFLNAKNKTKVNSKMVLLEAFPSTISQVAMGADATGYPTYTVGFQFREYIVG